MLKHKLLYAANIHAKWVLIVIFSAMYMIAPHIRTNAFQMPNRKVTIGTSRPSEVTSHVYNFDIISSPDRCSIECLYCDPPLVGAPCTPTPGLDVTGAVLAAQTGEIGFSIHA